MKTPSLILIALVMCGCGARAEAESVASGMKWSFAMRDLQQNGWTNTVTKPKSAAVFSDSSGNIYRYVNARGDTVDIVTEEVGKIERVYRVFDVNGKELDGVRLKQDPAK